MPTKLTYDVSPNPTPIYASVKGPNPNEIDLIVSITNDTKALLSPSKIAVQIPVGANIGQDLSSNPQLPPPVFNQTLFSQWKVITSGDLLIIQPQAGASLGADSLIVTIPGIQVNQKTGNVTVTISEWFGEEHATQTMILNKRQGVQPVLKLYADPPILHDQDKTVTLHWICGPQGKDYIYQVTHTPGEGHYTCQDGDAQHGVTSIPLTQTTTFTLKAIQTGATEGSKVAETLTLIVPVEAPQISSDYHQDAYFGGGILRLGWLAQHADYCVIHDQVNDTVKILDPHAPLDTYQKGKSYPLVLNNTEVNHLTVSAVAGRTKATLTMLAIHPPDPTQVTFSTKGSSNTDVIMSVAVTPNNQLALIIDYATNTVWVADVATRTVESQSIAVNDFPSAISITPDGKLALVVCPIYLDVIDIAQRKKIQSLKIFPFEKKPAISPDGTVALIPIIDDSGFQLIDLQTFKPVFTRDKGDYRFAAFSPLGKHAYLIERQGDKKFFVTFDLQTHKDVSSIELHNNAGSLLVTPDGKWAIVIGLFTSIIDLESGQLEPKQYPMQSGNNNLQMTPDQGLFLSRDAQGVTVFDFPSRRLAAQSFKADFLVNFALTPDGKQLLLLQTDLGGNKHLTFVGPST